MKLKYSITISLLVIIAIFFCCRIWATSLGADPRLANLIQSIGMFIALVTALIALSVADPSKKLVKMNIELFTSKPSKCYKKDLSADLRTIYQKFPDPIKSYRVEFKITNNSGFTLKKPTLTFRLPIQKQHPFEGRITFNSNLFNSQEEMRLLEFANTRILSNSNLPYWNDKDDMTIWIRMFFGDMDPFSVDVSVNCENAEGVTEEVKIEPQKLLNK